ncbi:MAG: SRPBCC family protein [Acidimicrobiales bacterium]
MELTNEFKIDRNVDETWKILNDLEFIAPCMPGAQLQEVEGDEYRGVVKVKVGPITAQYKGKASFVEQDEANKVAKLKAEGRDPRQGNANATVTATMTPVGDSATNVSIQTDLSLSGKIASFGRGAIEDVSKKILGQFTDNLRDKLAETGPASASTAAAGASPTGSAAPAPATAASGSATAPAQSPSTGTRSSNAGSVAGVASSTAASSSTAGSSGSAAAGSSAVRKIDSPEPEPVDLLSVSGGSMAKRALPVAGGVALLLMILYWILGRRD